MQWCIFANRKRHKKEKNGQQNTIQLNKYWVAITELKTRCSCNISYAKIVLMHVVRTL
jgi:hypothetical protein